LEISIPPRHPATIAAGEEFTQLVGFGVPHYIFDGRV
jgi:hypothetical protein